ncbi:hypothetical protein BC830DRAFT_1099608 [Chytriomyces sp. MP71]|nr:hypothetical protein BC830DRAFT_1099608 [Chytriomyces sp. MP71]
MADASSPTAQLPVPASPSTPEGSNLPVSARVPKFNKFANNIAALTERTKLAREELEKMLNVTAELKEQCQLQEKETAELEKEQALAVGEVESLKKRIESLTGEKSKIEAKLEDLRNENARLDAFVKQHETALAASK